MACADRAAALIAFGKKHRYLYMHMIYVYTHEYNIYVEQYIDIICFFLLGCIIDCFCVM